LLSFNKIDTGNVMHRNFLGADFQRQWFHIIALNHNQRCYRFQNKAKKLIWEESGNWTKR